MAMEMEMAMAMAMAMEMEWTMEEVVSPESKNQKPRNLDLYVNLYVDLLAESPRNQDGSKVAIRCLHVPCSTRCGSTHNAFPPMDPNW